MADTTTQAANQAQDATRSIFQAAQNTAGMQLNVMQRLGKIQQRLVRQAIAASHEQMQLVGKVRAPRAFAQAQADLVKRQGQRTVESVREAFEVVAEGWQDYADQLQGTTHTVTDKAQRTLASRRAA
jgi:hypothetical protein